ncbi:hypothetical protein CLI64_29605 (plasmid) [Nostoc sp. CENA543]|uniref:hypothetical protein n=1 Tax=Nostoc sp. CENA543 TaxID=1869241 RepID=UPI000CA21FB1|nr:hypothetical protein [Nostoc sp. CENA543]AUT04597.1 hypothetical protein CLI64_29605 [Nostoc sp. CENA543]
MTIYKTIEVYRDYRIEVDLDDLPDGMNWCYWIEDEQGNLLAEGSFQDSADSSLETAYSIIDDELRRLGIIDLSTLAI